MKVQRNGVALFSTVFLPLAAFGAAALFTASAAAADRYPARPVTMVVPFAAGTSTDAFARLIAEHLSRAFSSPVIIENKAGAGGMIGAGAVARAQPNGYTLLVATNTTHSVVKSLFKSVPYDPMRDFTPVARVARMSQMLAVNASVPVKTAAEFVAYAKSNPGKIRYGYGASSGQIAGETLKNALGIDIVAVGYRSNTPALTDLISGNIEAMIVDLANGVPQVKAGKIRALGMLAAKRSGMLPDVPTLSETVVPGMQVVGWTGILAPAGTPQDIVQLLSNELKKFAVRSDIRDKLQATTGVELDYEGPEGFAPFLKTEEARWTEMAKSAGIRPE